MEVATCSLYRSSLMRKFSVASSMASACRRAVFPLPAEQKAFFYLKGARSLMPASISRPG
jgi:hypothetical protein